MFYMSIFQNFQFFVNFSEAPELATLLTADKVTSGLPAPIAHSLRPAALGGPFFRTTQRFLVQTDQLLVEKLRILHWSVVTLKAV